MIMIIDDCFARDEYAGVSCQHHHRHHDVRQNWTACGDCDRDDKLPAQFRNVPKPTNQLTSVYVAACSFVYFGRCHRLLTGTLCCRDITIWVMFIRSWAILVHNHVDYRFSECDAYVSGLEPCGMCVCLCKRMQVFLCMRILYRFIIHTCMYSGTWCIAINESY